MGVAIKAEGLTFSYRGEHGDVPVLRGVSMDLGAGSYTALMGQSGAGKSTLLALLGGLIPPQGGGLHVGEWSLASIRRRTLAAYRRTVVGFVFQQAGLFDVLTSVENVELALGLEAGSRRGRRGRAMDALRAVDLEDRAHHRPAQLSGGERQRVSIARALVTNPALVLADEPTGNLDEVNTEAVLDLMERMREQYGSTLLIVTHNAAVAGRADRTLSLADGQLAVVKK